MRCRAQLTIEFLDDWNSSSGDSLGAVAASAVYRNEDGLPALGEGTVKGLLREAVRELEDLGRAPLRPAIGYSWTVDLFGGRGAGTTEDRIQRQPSAGILGFTGASLPERERTWLLRQKPALRERLLAQFFRFLSSTALVDGMADDGMLRTVEVAIPCRLVSTISGPVGQSPEPDWYRVLGAALPLLRSAGLRRHRGLGRCRFELGPVEDCPETPSILSKAASEWIRIVLQSPAVFPLEARSEGLLEGHDYLPGSALWGAAIQALVSSGEAFNPVRFERDLRFSPGYPLTREDRWAVPIPLTWYQIKADPTQAVHNWLGSTGRSSEPRDDRRKVQIRSGYVVPGPGPLRLVRPALRSRIKTAMDEERHDRPKPGQLYGFATIPAGSHFAARVGGDPDTVAAVLAALESDGVRLGRARNPGFGQFKIDRLEVPPVEFPSEDLTDRVVIYLLSDLALYRDGTPVLQPRGEDFSPRLANWAWSAQESSVRVRTYAPWNAFHQGFDYQRQLLVRGSVLVFRPPDGEQEMNSAALAELRESLESDGIGAYRAEGFGLVLVNPAFALRDEPGIPFDGEVTREIEAPADVEAKEVGPPTPLTCWLAAAADRDCAIEAECQARSWLVVLEALLAQQKGRGYELPSPSQWAALQDLATRYRGAPDRLRTRLAEYCGYSNPRRLVWEQVLRLGGANVTLRQWLASLLEPSETSSPAIAVLAFELVARAIQAREGGRDEPH
ncbi:MAG: hypothetical protein JNK85_27075 [Verrucomicrobiales bacterium]|nr:hypothetical protein [Verrucomicrobiales bacterium]